MNDKEKINQVTTAILENSGSIAHLDKKLLIYLSNQSNVTSMDFRSPANILIDYAKICVEMQDEFLFFNSLLNSIVLVRNKESNLIFNILKPIDEFYQYYSEHIIVAERRIEPYFVLIDDKTIFSDRHCPAKLQGHKMYNTLRIGQKLMISLITKASQAQLATNICHNYNFSF